MAISRPLLMVLIGALVVLAATTGMRVLGSSGAEAPAATRSATSGSPEGDTASTASVRPKAQRPARETAATAAKKAAKVDDPQTRVLRAIAARKVVVLFFGQYRSADDQATRRAVRAVGRDGQRVEVFTASIKDVADYPRVVGTLGIQQSPSTIVIDRTGRARVVQGFLDTGSLRQLVADARN